MLAGVGGGGGCWTDATGVGEGVGDTVTRMEGDGVGDTVTRMEGDGVGDTVA
jgi:hypothetical protein